MFSPELYVSSKIFTNFVLTTGELDGKEILDMGCGTGIIGIAASSKKAKCTAADINPEAIKSANENFKANNVNALAVESNLFSNLDSTKKFDVIYFNPPYYNYEPKGDYERAFGGGKNYRVIRDFVSRSKDFLNSPGFICLIISTDMDIEIMFTILKEQGFRYNILQKTQRFFETFYIIQAFLEST